jgi:hypothetical protein
MRKLNAERARELLHYDPETGILRWKVSRGGRAPAGSVAGSLDRNTGRRVIVVNGVQTRTYRVAWLIMTGEWPSHSIDHINGDPSDDRWCNLREATPAQQNGNMPALNRSRTGIRGVSRHHRKFSVRIKGRYIGLYATLEDAEAAYAAAAIAEYGEFARVSAAGPSGRLRQL